MSDDAPVEEEEDDQAWLATFADLMSLLMCFFVLLLSFSEMDLDKYRQIAGSLRTAFGVQRQIEAPDPPKGTSFIAQEFTPGKPVQIPVDVTKQEADKDSGKEKEKEEAELSELIKKLSEILAPEIESGAIEMVTIDGELVVRILEGDSFPSGSARLQKSFYPILERLAGGLDDNTGRIVVAGHTDNVPIATRAYPSNWVLSSARAANVVHHLSTLASFEPGKIEMRAYADTRPLADNALAENRARNRRVEIIVTYSNDPADEDEASPVANADDAATDETTGEPSAAAALDATATPTPPAAPAPAVVPAATNTPATTVAPVLPASVQPPPPLELEPEIDEPEIRIESE